MNTAFNIKWKRGQKEHGLYIPMVSTNFLIIISDDSDHHTHLRGIAREGMCAWFFMAASGNL